ncbi:MAG TPA: hypothetical protein VH723_00610 [Candidatus Limnocylindrales bacterium]|jgi:hypothetical protein
MTDQPMPRHIARRTIALALGALLVLGTGAWVAADELGLIEANRVSSEPTPPPDLTPEPTAEPTPTPTPTPESVMPSDDPLDDIEFIEPPEASGGRNIVRVNNHRDDDLKIKASAQLNRISRDRAAPVNYAKAYSSCVGCQTIAVALQINLIKRGTPIVEPFNAAVAINYECTRCVTVAIAYQYNLSVDDPKATPQEVRRLVKDMDKELRSISRDKRIGVLEAAERLDAVIARFVTLAEELKASEDVAREGTSEDADAPATPPPPEESPAADEPTPAPADPGPTAPPDPTPEPTAPPAASPQPPSSG